MAVGWSPRRTDLTALLAIGTGVVLLAALPVQYGGPPVHLHLAEEALLLYASTVAGPLLLAWGVFAFRDGPHRSLTPRRLGLAFALSFGVLAICHWRMAVVAPGPTPGDSLIGRPHLVPARAYAYWPDPTSSPVDFVLQHMDTSAIGPFAIGLAAVATARARHGRRVLLVAGALAGYPLVFVAATFRTRVGSGIALALLAGFGLVPLLVGFRFGRLPTAPEDDASESSDPVSLDARQRPAIDVPPDSDPEPGAASRDVFGGRDRRTTLAAFVGGLLLLGLAPARQFEVLWGSLAPVPLPLAVALSISGATLVVGTLVTVWRDSHERRSRPLT